VSADQRLPSEVLSIHEGLAIASPLKRLTSFCREEYDYYDEIHSSNPNRIEPVDILATVSVNSFVNNAEAVRKVHRALAQRCDSILTKIPESAELLSFDPDLEIVSELLDAAVQVKGVLVAVATKVLHRKRRALIPMLDQVVLDHYLEWTCQTHRKAWTQDKRRAASVAVDVLKMFRADLQRVAGDIMPLQAALASDGFPLSLVRILELLVWTEVETRGYYRKIPR
jgi:hypothetical protein